MIRKLNIATAILLVVSLTLAPTAMAADGSTGAWFSSIVEIVVDWVTGGGDLATRGESEPAPEPSKDKPMVKCGPGGETGPMVDPHGPGC